MAAVPPGFEPEGTPDDPRGREAVGPARQQRAGYLIVALLMALLIVVVLILLL